MIELVLAIFYIILSIVLRISGKYPYIDLCCAYFGMAFFMLYLTSDTPSAIDVYQGKTTLEITYKDGVPVDSVVVFKNKEK